MNARTEKAKMEKEAAQLEAWRKEAVKAQKWWKRFVDADDATAAALWPAFYAGATNPPAKPPLKLSRYLCSAEYGKRTVGRRIAANDAFDAGCLFLAKVRVDPAAVFIREVK